MGQLRQVHRPVGTKPLLTLRERGLPPLVLGFTVSSIAVFAAADFVGEIVRSRIPTDLDLLLAGILVVCGVTDILAPGFRHSVCKRQTRKDLTRRYPPPITGLLWGLDAGTVVSTYRTSMVSWAALALTLGGWGPWWVGIVYASAFCIPLTILTMSYPVDGSSSGGWLWRQRSTESLIDVIFSQLSRVRFAAALTAVSGAILVVVGIA